MLRALVLLVVGTLVTACDPPQYAPSADELLIRNVVVISPERDVPGEEVDVLVRDGRIAEIGTALTIDTHAMVIDGRGRFLSPGLIDGHTHLDEIPGMTFEHESAYPEIAREARAQIPRSHLYHGFTTVIDLNSRPDVIEAWNAHELRPTAYFCGAAPVFDGYPMSWMPKPARYRIMPYFLYDETRAADFPDGFDPAEHTSTKIVAKIQADGGICIKTHYERGFGGRGDLPVPTVDTIRELVAAAHELDMPVLLHANSQSAQSFGLEVGVDAFAHGMWTWDDRSATEPNDEIMRILDAVIESGIAWQPTIQVLYGERDLHDSEYLSRTELQHVMPQSLIDWYATEDGQWWRDRMRNIPFVADLLEQGRWRELDAEPIARVTAALGYLYSNGGHLIFGSDTPSDPTFANPPGLNARMEMRRWFAAGVTPAQLFRAATLANAEFYGLQSEIGTVESGKRADLLLLTRNPLVDPAAFDAIDVVIIGGRAVDRAELSASRISLH